MTEERHLSKVEASLGLTLLAGLLAVLVGVYVYRFDQPTSAAPRDPHRVSAQPAAAASSPVEQTAYRPEWLAPHDQGPPQPFVR